MEECQATETGIAFGFFPLVFQRPRLESAFETVIDPWADRSPAGLVQKTVLDSASRDLEEIAATIIYVRTFCKI